MIVVKLETEENDGNNETSSLPPNYRIGFYAKSCRSSKCVSNEASSSSSNSNNVFPGRHQHTNSRGRDVLQTNSNTQHNAGPYNTENPTIPDHQLKTNIDVFTRKKGETEFKLKETNEISWLPVAGKVRFRTSEYGIGFMGL